MTKRTARIAEICGRAITPKGVGYIPNHIAASRLTSVENVKRNIITRREANSVMSEWLKAKEEHKKWSLRQ
jgi:hypothetical protein